MRHLVLVAGLTLYPLVVHLLVLQGAPGPAVAVLVGMSLLLLGMFLRAPARTRPWAWIGAYMALAAAGLASLLAGSVYALFVPPVLLNLILAAVFGATLHTGSIPLVERFMRLERAGPVPPVLAGYARRLTFTWTVFFLGMALLALALALLAPLPVWSLFANVLSYLCVALLFVGQFVYGYARYRDHGASAPWTAMRRLLLHSLRRPFALARDSGGGGK